MTARRLHVGPVLASGTTSDAFSRPSSAYTSADVNGDQAALLADDSRFNQCHAVADLEYDTAEKNVTMTVECGLANQFTTCRIWSRPSNPSGFLPEACQLHEKEMHSLCARTGGTHSVQITNQNTSTSEF